MQTTSTALIGRRIHTGDHKELGAVHDILLEDDTQRVRWLTVKTGGWWDGRLVLLPPARCQTAVEGPTIDTDLTQEQVRSSPTVDWDRPIDRSYERLLLDHYLSAPYWTSVPGAMAPMVPVLPAARSLAETDTVDRIGHNHLRSVEEMKGYHLRSGDGQDVGHIADLIVDLTDWRIRFVIIDTRNWLPGGRKLVLPIEIIERFDYPLQEVITALDEETLSAAPDFDPQRQDQDYQADCGHRLGFIEFP